MKKIFDLKDGKAFLTIESADIDGMSDEMLVLNHLVLNGKLRIGALVFHFNQMGGSVFDAPRKKTTVRKMYQIIRNLRDLNCPIVGDSFGVKVAETVGEIEMFANHLEQKAKSDIASMMTLRKTMLKMVESKTPSLFDTLFGNE